MNEERFHFGDLVMRTDRGELRTFALDPQGERTQNERCLQGVPFGNGTPRQNSRSQLTPQLHPQFAKRVFSDPLTILECHSPEQS